MRARTTHDSELSDREIGELRAIFTARRLTVESGEELERARRYVSQLIVDLLAVRLELRRERERARAEADGLRDLLGRARPRLPRGLDDEDFAALVAEIDDALRPRRATSSGRRRF